MTVLGTGRAWDTEVFATKVLPQRHGDTELNRLCVSVAD